MWTKRERFDAVLNHEVPDRPPISAWRHFTDLEHSGAEMLANAMLDWHNKYDWDYMKVNSRAVYYEEIWGAEFDYNAYNGKLCPPCITPAIECKEDLEKIIEMPPSCRPLQEQIDAAKLLVDRLDDGAPVFYSLFAPTAIFQKLCNVDSIGRYRKASRGDLMVTLMHEEPELVHKALKNIANTMAAYVQEMAKTGVYGFFYAATGLSRTGYLTREEWDEFVRPYDMITLEAMGKCAPMLHACGIQVNPQWFADYPIKILHWPESATGNPSLDSSVDWIGKSIVPMGGCDERLFGQNKAKEIYDMSKSTQERMKNIPFILAPDCSILPNSMDEEIKAFRSSVEK